MLKRGGGNRGNLIDITITVKVKKKKDWSQKVWKFILLMFIFLFYMIARNWKEESEAFRMIIKVAKNPDEKLTPEQ